MLELAYTIAASMAFKEACIKAGLTAGTYYGCRSYYSQLSTQEMLFQILNSRRGKILSMSQRGLKKSLRQKCLRKMFGYSTDLRSKSQGRANFSMTFKNYRT